MDVAVHSLKDLPVDGPPGLSLVATLARDDPRELLLARLEALGPGRLGLCAGAPHLALGAASTAAAAKAGVAERTLESITPDAVVEERRRTCS